MDTANALHDFEAWNFPVAEPSNYTKSGPSFDENQFKSPYLLDRLRAEIHAAPLFSLRTEEAYVGQAKRFILFHGKRHPKEMDVEEITEFFSWLAAERQVSVAT
ncbi:site-specific integrase [Azohydromonas lata]|uniref:site-specific integrase n=1 Tax=Azohydromonas lata TaxID=45677 RepID=UPI0008336C34|nr:site-specific integrase [Azohydromonas lata]